MGIGSMGVMHPQLVMRNIIPVVMAGVLGIYGLIVSVILLGASEKTLLIFLVLFFVSNASRNEVGERNVVLLLPIEATRELILLLSFGRRKYCPSRFEKLFVGAAGIIVEAIIALGMVFLRMLRGPRLPFTDAPDNIS